mmetsp:Transcript_73900/g.225998  ORF Transcript_73900/g.225998 Transcript_73900/m.225998 type:complete len:207 (+) Transcript_73900:371-991(+)
MPRRRASCVARPATRRCIGSRWASQTLRRAQAATTSRSCCSRGARRPRSASRTRSSSGGPARRARRASAMMSTAGPWTARTSRVGTRGCCAPGASPGPPSRSRSAVQTSSRSPRPSWLGCARTSMPARCPSPREASGTTSGRPFGRGTSRRERRCTPRSRSWAGRPSTSGRSSSTPPRWPPSVPPRGPACLGKSPSTARTSATRRS